MRNNYRYIVFVSLLITLTTVVSGQRKVITAKNFDYIDSKAKLLLATTSYRIIKTSDSEKTVEEYVPPDRNHISSEYSMNGKSWTMEWITIGRKMFERKNGGRWKKISFSDSRFISPVNTASGTDYFSDGSVVIDGKKADVFVVVWRSKDHVPVLNLEISATGKTTYWYDGDGRRLKVLYETQLDNKEKTQSIRTAIYEYDPTIKIEAPTK